MNDKTEQNSMKASGVDVFDPSTSPVRLINGLSISNNSKVSSRAARLLEAPVSVAAWYHDTGAVVPRPDGGRSLNVSIATTIIDRLAGSSKTVDIYGSSLPIDWVCDKLRDPLVRDTVAKFFLSRQIDAIIQKNLGVRVLDPSQPILTKVEMINMIHSALGTKQKGVDKTVSQVISALVLPVLLDIGCVSPTRRFALHIHHPVEAVELEHIRSLLVRNALTETFARVKTQNASKTLKQGGRMSARVFSEALGTIFFQYGIAISTVRETSSLLDDIVLAVRGHIDHAALRSDEKFVLSSSLVNDPAVVELAQCLPFIQAAVGVNLQDGHVPYPSNEQSLIASALVEITAILRSDERYHWISKSAFINEYSINKVDTASGVPLSAVVVRDVRASAISQTVLAVEDATVSGGNVWDIQAPHDRLKNQLETSYGSATFSSQPIVSDLFLDVLANIGETMQEPEYSDKRVGLAPLYVVDVEQIGRSPSELALMFASSVRAVVYTDQGVTKTGWWYRVDGANRATRVKSGVVIADALETSDPVEVFLALADRASQAQVTEVQRQLLSPEAFSSSLVGYDKTSLVMTTSVLEFTFRMNKTKLTADLSLATLYPVGGTRLTRVVKPSFNVAVVSLWDSVIAASLDAITSLKTSKGEEAFQVQATTLRDRVYRYVAMMATNEIGIEFRSDVHRSIIDQTLKAESTRGEAAALFRAQMVNKTLAAYSDVVALLFMIFAQGMSSPTLARIIDDPEMVDACRQLGSSRTLN